MDRRSFLLSAAGCAAAPPPAAQALRIDTAGDLGLLHDFWSTSVTTTQDYFTDPRRRAQVREQNPFARYINCVRFLGGSDAKKDDWFRGLAPDGSVRTDFSGAVQQLRGILDGGFTPRIVLDNVPAALSGTDLLNKYGNTAPPKNPDHWHAYVSQLVRELVKAFGRQRAGSWRFRVGTEPDLRPGHWSGTEEEYYRHYDCTVDAVAALLPEVDIGPGNILDPFDNARARYPHERWGHRLIDHCARGRNFKTGGSGARMTYFGFSWYGHVGLPITLLDDAVRFLRGRLSEHPRFASLPLDIQEFSVLSDHKGRRLNHGEASEWSASWMALVADRAYALGLGQIYQWATTLAGVPVPRTHVLGFLESMRGGRRLPVSAPAPSPAMGSIGCLAGARAGGFDLLVYRHRDEHESAGPATVSVTLAGAPLAGRGWRVAKAAVVDSRRSGFIRQLYADIEDAGFRPLDSSALLVPTKEKGDPPGAPLYGLSLRDRYGPEAQPWFNARAARYRELGALRDLSPAPVLSRSAAGWSCDLTLEGHSVVSMRIEGGR